MKKVLQLIILLQLLCFFATAQNPNDFYVAFSKSKANDTLHVYVSVQLHQNLSYEVIDLQIKEKGSTNTQAQAFRLSNRFPYGIVNGYNMYIYHIPYKSADGIVYEVTLHNNRLCNIGPLKLEEELSSENMHTYSYANPGFKLVNPVKLKKS